MCISEMELGQNVCSPTKVQVLRNQGVCKGDGQGLGVEDVAVWRLYGDLGWDWEPSRCPIWPQHFCDSVEGYHKNIHLWALAICILCSRKPTSHGQPAFTTGKQRNERIKERQKNLLSLGMQLFLQGQTENNRNERRKADASPEVAEWRARLFHTSLEGTVCRCTLFIMTIWCDS